MSEQYVSMTPIVFDTMKTIRFARTNEVDAKMLHHAAGGQYTGIIVNREIKGENASVDDPEMQLEFTCVMYNNRTRETHAETRRLKFWFMNGIQSNDQPDEPYTFFRELINPDSLPRDYIGFIKKILKLLHGPHYTRLRRVDFDIVPLTKQEQEAMLPAYQFHNGRDPRPLEQRIRETVQMRLEEAYPNVLSMDDLIRILDVNDRNLLQLQLNELESRDLIQFVPLEGKSVGQVGFRRKINLQNQEVKEVNAANHMQQVSYSEKPSIAIITNLLCEKLAVDAMIEKKTTFVRYKTEGESHVYTIGTIGPHRVISTKVPMVGRELQAKISSASITTRLLGAFQSVQHVFLVGVGGSVPHVCEFEKHSRLGDVVVSAPVNSSVTRTPQDTRPQQTGPVYIYCDRLIEPQADAPEGTPLKFILKRYAARDCSLLECTDRVLDQFELCPEQCQWAQFIDRGLELMSESGAEAADYNRPPAETDKLKVKIDEGLTVDIKHPDVPQELARFYPSGVPAVRLGCMGSGRPVTDNDQLRDTFAKEHQLLCYDAEYDQVLESVLGNGLESFLIIRGIADYADGRVGTQWQPYAALAAAALMKAVILQLDPVIVSEA